MAAQYKKSGKALLGGYVVLMAAVVVGVDILFFRHLFWWRLIANALIVAAFLAFYLLFLRHK